MIVREINNKKQWNDFAQSHSFLQSWEWGELQKDLNKKFWRLAVMNKKNILLLALLYKNDLSLFNLNYLYSPRGPVMASNSNEVFEIFLKKIKEIAERENSIFFRIDPEWQSDNLIRQFNFRKWIGEVQPKNTLILNLDKDESTLLSEMHPKTRYNIRLAERKGIKIKFSRSRDSFEKFWQLIEETSKRDKFKIHPKEYYWKILKASGGKVSLALAEYKNKILAANMISFFGKTAVYMHGASSNQHRNLMAPYLVQWTSIKEAKRRGCKYYDFWGIAPSDSANHPWAGLTRFKKNFSLNNKGISFIGAWDLVFKEFWYFLYKVFKKIKKFFK